jgi:selenocysteine-specific elongation factor
MRRLILGTAGHIDHGKTALVRALTGVDTDRLKEEKARGITIELGFAELEVGVDHSFGVVDVPGHEGFVRTMVAGATGMDVVLLVVAADEGVMPQTREHVAIVRLLGVDRLAVALTKADLVDDEWLELVTDDVRDLLADTPYAGAPIVATSAETGQGLEALTDVLGALAVETRGRDSGDVLRLPIDRVFTVRGTGTVVTGTLWTGTLTKGQRIRVEPHGPEARIRGLQVHGREVGSAEAGARAAVALVGPDVGRGGVTRGQCVVTSWPPSNMLTARLSVLPDAGWQVEHGQRVRVHAGTAEVMARCVVPSGVIPPGDTDWLQLRLEEPVIARARDRLIVRSYSPVTTIAGAAVAEPHPLKRSRFSSSELERLETILNGAPAVAVEAALEQGGWAGIEVDRIPLATGLAPSEVEHACSDLLGRGALTAAGSLHATAFVSKAEAVLTDAVAEWHRRQPLQSGIPLEILRQKLPPGASEALADAVIRRLREADRLAVRGGVAALPDFTVRLSDEAQGARDRLADLYRSAGLAPPTLRELPEDLRARRDFDALLELLVTGGDLQALDQGLYVWRPAVDDMVTEVMRRFGGRSGLSPGDFREVVPLTRKYLMPLLSYLDGEGVTVRDGDKRSVRASD